MDSYNEQNVIYIKRVVTTYATFKQTENIFQRMNECIKNMQNFQLPMHAVQAFTLKNTTTKLDSTILSTRKVLWKYQ